MQKTVISVN